VSSFTRTIPSGKSEAQVQELLSRRDHYLPLAFRPTRAGPGDLVYLIFRGLIVGRARISAVEPALRRGNQRYPRWARWIVRYAGRWERPPRPIPVQGHQSVRYLESHSLQHLDQESW
jgi:hypothetical protein